MGKIIKIRLHKKTALCIMALYIFVGVTGQAQEEENSELSIYGEVGFDYSDNVFRLTDDQMSTMEENDSDDMESGRYRGMDSLSDYIVQPRIGIKWDLNSPFGGDLRLSSWLRYNSYLNNDDSDYPEGRVKLRNSIGEKGALILEGNFLYGFRKKNYLSSAIDINGNGNISKDERTYSAATYNEYEGVIGYRHEFIKDKDKMLSELNIRPFAGYSNRAYNSCFENRDKDTAFGGMEVQLEFFNQIDLGVTYKYESVSSPGNEELVLFDETISLMDVNGDRIIRGNAPLVTDIDRSADRHTFRIEPSIKLTKDITLHLGYSKRTSKYTSDNPLDIEHYNQKAYRKKYRAGISYDFLNSWSAEAEYSRIKNEDEEDGIYSENNFMFTVRYKF